MKLLDNTLESVMEKVRLLYHADVECHADICSIHKKRTLVISEIPCSFHFEIDHDISFRNLGENGTAFNQAEIYLYPEEYPAFVCALKNHSIPFPADYRQWQIVNPHIMSVCIEASEPPEDFAQRLSAALEVLGQP